MQTLRTLFAQLMYLLKDRIGWSAINLGLLGIVIFLTAFLAALARRLLTPRWALLVMGAGLGLARLGIQVWTGDPLGDLYLAIAGTVFFVLFLPVALGHVRGHGGGLFTLGLLLGLALDLAIHGAYGTWDAAWRSGSGTLVLTVLLAVLQVGLVWITARTPPGDPSDSPGWPALAWLGIGPFLFLELLRFGNLAALNALTGWGMASGLAWMLLSHTAGLAAAAGVLVLRRRLNWLAGLAGAALVVVAALLPVARNTPLPAVVQLVGQVGAALSLAVIVQGLEARTAVPGLARTTLAHGIGMMLLVLLVFLSYAGMDIRLPISASLLPPVAAVILGLCALGASLVRGEEVSATQKPWLPAGLAALLLVIPLVLAFSWPTPASTPGRGLPVRVMQYNLHGGFDTSGRLDLEALARTIEEQQPDIVGLQEVSRGWVINGSADMLLWLSHRLQMPYAYGPTIGGVWGNAILSRYPVRSVEEHALPPSTLLMGRGFVVAQVDVGAGQALQVIDTHLHHVGADHAVRLEQVRVLLAYWSGASRTVFTGDFNAAPDEPAAVALYEAGLQDVCVLAGIGPCYTNADAHPVVAMDKQIDYIWLSPDLQASDVVIPATSASDHLPVVATVGRSSH
jgi:endonuclease/exonuclease/phosphatase family metal-dependent hydrolase